MVRPLRFSPARESSSLRDPVGMPSVSVGQGACRAGSGAEHGKHWS